MGRRFPLAFADKQLAAVAVEFPVNPAGIVTGNIGAVINQIIGTLKGKIRLPVRFPGAGVQGKRLVRCRRACQQPYAACMGNTPRKAKKTQRVKNGEFIISGKIRTPERYVKGFRPSGKGGDFFFAAHWLGVKIALNTALVFGGQEQAAAD